MNKKLNVAIIGQGRSGRDIHGLYFKSPENKNFNVAAVVEKSEERRERAKNEYGCDAYSDYTELFGRNDIDIVVNSSYSHMHMPISIDLFSKSEKQQIVRQLTADLSTADYPFQLIAVSRPVDISPLLSELSDTLTACSDLKQKELLKQEMAEMSSLAVSGDTVERQFYIKIWEKAHENTEREMLQRLKYLEGYLSDAGVRSEILGRQDIIRLCNLINNPAYVHLEDSDADPVIPMIAGYNDE